MSADALSTVLMVKPHASSRSKPPSKLATRNAAEAAAGEAGLLRPPLSPPLCLVANHCSAFARVAMT